MTAIPRGTKVQHHIGVIGFVVGEDDRYPVVLWTDFGTSGMAVFTSDRLISSNLTVLAAPIPPEVGARVALNDGTRFGVITAQSRTWSIRWGGSDTIEENAYMDSVVVIEAARGQFAVGVRVRRNSGTYTDEIGVITRQPLGYSARVPRWYVQWPSYGPNDDVILAQSDLELVDVAAPAPTAPRLPVAGDRVHRTAEYADTHNQRVDAIGTVLPDTAAAGHLYVLWDNFIRSQLPAAELVIVEPAAAERTVESVTAELEAFKRSVVTTAREQARIHGWCSQVDRALESMGLAEYMRPAPRKMRLTIEVEVEVQPESDTAGFAFDFNTDEVVGGVSNGSLSSQEKPRIVNVTAL